MQNIGIKVRIIGADDLSEEEKNVVIAAVLAYCETVLKGRESFRKVSRKVEKPCSYWNYSKYLFLARY